MHAVLVEEVQEVSLLRLVHRGQHVLRVEQHPNDVGELAGIAQSRILVAVHLLDDHVHEEQILKIVSLAFNSLKENESLTRQIEQLLCLISTNYFNVQVRCYQIYSVY